MSPGEVCETLHHPRDISVSSALMPFYPIVIPVPESTAAHHLSSRSFVVDRHFVVPKPFRNTCFNLKYCCKGRFAVCLLLMRGDSWLMSLFCVFRSGHCFLRGIFATVHCFKGGKAFPAVVVTVLFSYLEHSCLGKVVCTDLISSPKVL